MSIRKPYKKPELVRYGTVQALTATGHPQGVNMDVVNKLTKTGA